MKKISRNGFSFVELLVVVTIIAVIFSAGVVSYAEVSKKSRDARRKSDLEAIRSSLELCRSYAGVYPDFVYPSVSCGTPVVIYLQATPEDPKSGEQYVYSPNGTNSSYTVTANLESPSYPTEYELTNP